jgi:hypothetical protein
VFDAAGQYWNVDPGTLRAMMPVESSGNPNAVSPAGAQGLMQLMPATAKAVGVDPTNPVQSIFGAARVMSENLDHFGNVPDALRAYNAGWDKSRWNNPETQAYVDKVAAHYAPSVPVPNTTGTPMPMATPVAVDPQDAANAVNPLGAGSAPQQGPDTYTALFGDTAPKVANSNSPVSSGAQPPATYDALFGSTDPKTGTAAKSSWHQGSALQDIAALGRAGVEGVGKGLDHAIVGTVNLIPGMSGVLKGTGLDPAALAPADQAAAADAAAVPGGQTAATIGNLLGQAVAGGIAAEGAGAALGAAGLSAAGALGGTAGRAIQVGTKLLTGAGQGSRAGNALALATSGAAKGVVGGIAGTGSTDNMGFNALAGGVASPVFAAAAPVIGRGVNYLASGIGRGLNGVADSLAPRAAADAASAPNPLSASSAPATPGTINPLAAGTPTTPSAPVPNDAAAVPAPVALAAPESAPVNAPAPDVQNATSATPEAQASSASPPSASRTPPEAIKLGLFASPEDGEKIGQQVYDSYAAGGPVQLVQSKIPGVQLTAAQATGNPGLALLERNRRAANPSPFVALDQQNAAARNAYAQQIVGTPEQLEQARGALAQMDAQSRPQVFGSQQPVDTAPIKAEVQAAIDANKGRPTVQAPLQNVLKQIQAVEIPSTAAEGEESEAATAMPADLWNVRKYLGDMVAPRATGTANDGQAAATQLLGLKPTFDQQIEAGAPGFQNYLQQYSAMSKPIDAMQYLQNKFPTDQQGNMQLGGLDRFIKGINRSQNSSGYSQADAITPEQYQGLSDLRDDMRLGSRIDLGKARGSDTNVNLMTTGRVANMMAGSSPKVASMLTGAGAALVGHPVEGGLVGLGANALANKLASAQVNRLAAVRSAAESALDNRLLNPYGK